MRDAAFSPPMATPPTVTIGASGAASAIVGGTDFKAQSDATLRFRDGNVIAYTATTPSDYYVQGHQSAAQGSMGFSVDKWIDSDRFEFFMKSSSSAYFRLRIDDVPVTASFQPISATNDGGLRRVFVSFPTWAARKITVECSASASFGGFSLPPTASSWKNDVPYARGIGFADSYGEESTFSSLLKHALRFLGFGDAWSSGQGGAGYVQVGGSGVQMTFVERGLLDIDPFTPDLVMVLDQDGSTAAATQAAAARTFWQNRRAALPNATLVGVANVIKGATAPIAADTAIKAEVEAVGGIWVPTENWITGTGRNNVQIGDGNADRYWGDDNTHPTEAGMQYLGARIAAYLQTRLPSKLTIPGGGVGLRVSAPPTVAPGFTPLTLSPSAWYKPTSLVALADSAPVVTWPDSSGNALDVTQANATKQPLWKTNVVNGYGVVRFDGTDDYLSRGEATIAGGDATVFVVYKTTGDNVLVGGAGTNHQLLRVGETTNRYTFYNGTSVGSSALAGARTAWTIGEMRRTFAGNLVEWWEAGTSRGSATPGVTQALKYGSIGALGSPNAVFTNGDIAEVIIYPVALSDANRALVRNHLGAKYGITVV